MIANGRLILDNGDSIPTTVDAVRIGDFIRDQYFHFIVGQVTGLSHIGPYPCFLIEKPEGRADFVLVSDAIILGYVDCAP